MVVRRRRKRHEQRRQPHRGNFRQRRRAGAADGNGRRAQRQIHFREERFHDGLDSARGIGGLHFFKIVRAGEMQPLPVLLPASSGSADKIISLRPLAPWLPPITRMVGPIRVKAERGAACCRRRCG